MKRIENNIGLIGTLITIMQIIIDLILKYLEMITLLQTIYLLIFFTIMIPIVTVLVKLTLRINRSESNIDSIVKYTNTMQKYFKFLHSHYNKKTRNTTVDLNPTAEDVNLHFTREELTIIEFSEYEINKYRK